jgi:hypothetical protein
LKPTSFRNVACVGKTETAVWQWRPLPLRRINRDCRDISNAARTDQEKKNDRELDHAYESTIKGRPDAKKNTDPWADVRSAPPTAAKNKQKWMPAGRFPPPWSVEELDAMTRPTKSKICSNFYPAAPSYCGGFSFSAYSRIWGSVAIFWQAQAAATNAKSKLFEKFSFLIIFDAAEMRIKHHAWVR